MEFRLLGPVEIRNADVLVNAGHARQRAVLAVLVLETGRVVPAELLIDRVWGADPPVAVRNVLYGYIARLRALLAIAADARIQLKRQSGGYLLQAGGEQVDLIRFRRLVKEAATAPDGQAATLLSSALGLWRGMALAGLGGSWLEAMRHTLELERHAAQLDLNDVRLRLGLHAALAAELTGQAAAAPIDERLAAQLMVALYRSGHPAESLRQYELTRRRLAGELGADPGPELRALHEQILNADPALNASALVAVTAAGRGTTPVPRELPPDVFAFTGRSAELTALDQILLPLTSHPGTPATAAVISAVSGTAGVGKTALALHWAHRAAAHFPDGQLHVNLRGYDSDQPVSASDALASFLRALGTPGSDIPAVEGERAARYRSLLAGKRTLILLDNAATVEQVRPLLPGSPDCRVIVTSRDSLAGLVARDGATRLDLDLLPLDDAIALLRALIGSRADAGPAALTDLAEHCARLPLALRIAAELAISRPADSLAELVTELADQQRRLELLHADGDPRTAVRVVFSWSYDHLDAASARAFRLAGLHPGHDFDAYALAGLTGSSLGKAGRTIESLTRAHLLHSTGTGRYGMHDLLRSYARELPATGCADETDRAALTRLLDFYLFAAASAMDVLYPGEKARRPVITPSPTPAPPVPDTVSATGWLQTERANVVAAAQFAAEADWPGHAIRFAETVTRFLTHGGYIADEAALYGAARRAARETGDRTAEGRVLRALGVRAWRMGQYREAADHQREALAMAREAGSALAEASSLHNLALVEKEQGAYDLAADHFQQAVVIYQRVGDRSGEAGGTSELGGLAVETGRYQQAAVLYEQALGLYRDLGQKTGEAVASANVGVAAERLGQYEQAAGHYERALALFRETGYLRGEAAALSNLGGIDRICGRLPQAADRQRRSIAILREMRNPAAEAHSHNELGEVLLADGRRGEAQHEHAVALQLASQIGHKRYTASAYEGLGSCFLAGDEIRLAREHWQRALAIFDELGVPAAGRVRTRLAELGDG